MIKTIRRGTALVAVSCAIAGLAAPAAHAADGKALFETNCVACHGAGGKGDGPAGQILNPKPADFSKALSGKADADIAKVIKEGGAAVGKSAMMAPMGSKLSDDDIKAVVAYIKTLAK